MSCRFAVGWTIGVGFPRFVFTVGIAGVQGIIGASIVADLLDDHELRTGYRQEAMSNASLSFSGKAISGLGALLGRRIITMIAFPTGVETRAVPPEATRRLGLIGGIAIPLLYRIPIALITRDRITEERHAEIRATLDARAR